MIQTSQNYESMNLHLWNKLEGPGSLIKQLTDQKSVIKRDLKKPKKHTKDYPLTRDMSADN